MSSDPNFDAHLDGTFGCLFWGVLAATGLWGVGALQAWYYYDKYRNDRKSHLYLVALVFITDTVHQGLIMHAIYIYCIRKWGNLAALDYLTGTLYQDVTLNGITGFLVQSFFIYRIWVFKQNYLIVTALSLLIVANLAMQFVYVGLGANLPTFVELRSIEPISLSINALTAIADVCISIAMVQDLYKARTGFAWSDSVVNRLMLFAINSGLVTSLCACGSLIFYLALPDTLIYFGLYLTIGRLYVNSLLATLNARKFIRSGLETSGQPESHSMATRSAQKRIGVTKSTQEGKSATQIQVQIETTRDYTGSGTIDIEKDATDSGREDMSSREDLKIDVSGGKGYPV